jgi:Flp pilus assembly protein TadG
MNIRRPVTRKRRANQRGAAMVESALVFTTLIGMIVASVDLGRILLSEQYLTERARTTARMAVVNDWTSSEVANFAAYGSTTAPTNGGSGNSTIAVSGLLGLVPSNVTFTKFADSGLGDSRYQVKISGMQMFTWIPGIAGRYTAPTVIATAPVQSLGSTE